MSLMQYITSAKRRSVDPPQMALHGADKYHGDVSANYDAKRQNDPKWILEQYWIEEMLSDLPMGSWVLDIPCGTGRFFQFYGQKGFIVRALDKSGLQERGIDGELVPGQLHFAAEKLKALHAQGLADGHKFRLAQGNVLKLGAPDKCVDASVMCRLSRWLSPDEIVTALKELQRVTRQRIILTARIANHPHARTIELIESALEGWKVHRNEVGSDMDYRILELRPTV